MRIDGFGKFAGFDRGPFECPVTIFQGANEAGKSTLLAFIRRVFFGFPDRRSRRNPYPPLAGGRHGGSMTIVSDAGETFTLQRFKGVGGGAVSLSTASGEPLPTVDLPSLLGHHSRDVFENVFAFTLDELHDDALLKDDRINSQIYSAGMGAAKLPEALKKLSEDKSGLFLKGGSKHALHEVAGGLDRVDSALGDVRNNAKQYGKLSARLEELKAELEQLNGRRREHQLRLDRQRRLESAWGDWNELDVVERDLAELPAIEEFPIDGVSRLEALEERVRTTRLEYDSAKRDLAEAESKTEARIEHAAILTHAAEIRSLEQGRTSFDSAVGDLPKRKIQLEEQGKILAATLKDLGADWDEIRLKNFDLSLAVREDISQYQEKLRKTRETLAHRESILDRDETALKEFSEAENRAEQALKAAAKPILGEEQLRRRRSLIPAASLRLNQRNSARERITTLQDQLDGLAIPAAPDSRRNNSKTFAVLGIVVGLAILVGGAVLGGPALPIAIFSGLALTGIAAYLYAFGRSHLGADAESPLAAPLRNSLLRAEEELKELQSKLKRDAASLGVEMIDETSLIAVGDALENEQNRALERQRLLADLEQAKELTRQRKNRMDRAKEAVKQARNQAETAQGEWLEWLRTRGLRDTFVPETVVELRGKVELGLNQLRELKDWQRRIEAIRKDISEYTAMVEPLASAFDIAIDPNDPRSIKAATGRLVELHGKVQRKIRDQTEAEAKLAEAKRRLEERESDFRNAEAEMKELLQSGRAANAEDFRAQASLHSRRAGLKDKRRDALARLQRLSGPGELLESLMQTLRETDIETIGKEARRLEEERDATAEKIQELSTQRGSIQTELENLTGEKESSKLRAERHRLLEDIRGHAREWLVHTIAENLLKEARGKFEKERQPDVLRHSEGYFRDMTGGRYQAVFSPLGRSEIHVKDFDGSTKQPDQLSRGAREQLFLALRFGLVRELGQRAERLPVIIDEALVNFDPDRGLRAARAFVELAEQNQVLVFTCHPQIVDWFARAAAEHGVQPPQTIPID